MQSDWKKQCTAKISFLCSVVGLNLCYRVRILKIFQSFRLKVRSFQIWEQPVKIVQEVYKDAPWLAPAAVSGMFPWTETFEQTQDLLEKLYLTVILRMDVDPPGGAEI